MYEWKVGNSWEVWFVKIGAYKKNDIKLLIFISSPVISLFGESFSEKLTPANQDDVKRVLEFTLRNV